jgi:ABC-type glycerol-3-phosphate transport system permease component
MVWLKQKQVVSHTILLFLLAITLYPLFFMVATSFKTTEQFYKSFWGFALPLRWSNYQVAFEAVYPFVLNSLWVTSITVVITLVVSLLSAYAFARFEFPLKNLLYYGLIALLMVPALLTLVPLFLQIRSFGLLNNHWGLILPYAAGSQVLGIFVLRGYLESLPKEIFEAARIDGAGEFTILWRIAVPMTLPAIATVAIFVGIAVWNDFILPLVVLSDRDLWTIPIGLVNFQNQFVLTQAWGPLFAGYVIASLPMVVLFLFTMRYFIRGLTAGAVKL